MSEEGTFVFGGHEYRLSTESLTFDEAEASCAADSGQIARCAHGDIVQKRSTQVTVYLVTLFCWHGGEGRLDSY
jgi:hypothetical protein